MPTASPEPTSSVETAGGKISSDSQYDISAGLRQLNIASGNGSTASAAPAAPQRNYAPAPQPQIWTDPSKPLYPNDGNAFTTNYFSPGPFNPLGKAHFSACFLRDKPKCASVGFNGGLSPASDYTTALNGMQNGQSLGWPIQNDLRGGVRTPSTQYNSALMSRASSGSYGLPPPRSHLHTPDPNVWNQMQQQQQYFNVFPGQNQRLPGAGASQMRQPSANYNMPDYAAFGGGASYPTGMVGSYNASDYSGGMLGSMRYEDRARGMRSPLLEEFRANRHRRWDLSVSFFHCPVCNYSVHIRISLDISLNSAAINWARDTYKPSLTLPQWKKSDYSSTR